MKGGGDAVEGDGRRVRGGGCCSVGCCGEAGCNIL